MQSNLLNNCLYCPVPLPPAGLGQQAGSLRQIVNKLEPPPQNAGGGLQHIHFTNGIPSRAAQHLTTHGVWPRRTVSAWITHHRSFFYPVYFSSFPWNMHILLIRACVVVAELRFEYFCFFDSKKSEFLSFNVVKCAEKKKKRWLFCS